jgi:hypothetical protein
MPLYLVPPVPASLPACAQATDGVACRCCPGGISRSTRGRVYPSDMSECGMGGHRAAAAGAGLDPGPGRIARPVLPPGHRQRDPLPDAQRPGMAGDAR